MKPAAIPQAGGPSARSGASAVGGVYPLLEAKWCRVTRADRDDGEPPEAVSRGHTVAFLSDVHHGPYVPRSYVRSVVAMTNALEPDIVALGGDYCHARDAVRRPRDRGPRPGLRAKLGRFAVLGNHDHWDGLAESQAGLAERAGIPLLRNAGSLGREGGQAAPGRRRGRPLDRPPSTWPAPSATRRPRTTP